MCQTNYNKKDKQGNYIIWNERKIIEHLYNIQDKYFTDIADELEKHKTTISREIKKEKSNYIIQIIQQK